jgi:hypothetical protein
MKSLENLHLTNALLLFLSAALRQAIGKANLFITS